MAQHHLQREERHRPKAGEPEQPQVALQRWWRLDVEVFKQVAHRALDHDISAIATQLAYHFTFSLFPALLVLATALTTIDAPDIFMRIMSTLDSVLPKSAITLVQQVLHEVQRGSGWQLFLTGLTLAVWSSVSGLLVLISAVNNAFGIPEHRPYWKRAILAIFMTMLLTTLLIIATFLMLGGHWLAIRITFWSGLNTEYAGWWVMLRWPLTIFAVISGLVVLYTAAPNLPISAFRALPGAILGGSGWVIATSIFGWYIQNFASYNRVYGSIGGVIVLMLWMYMGGMVILLGAELNGVLYRRRHGLV